MGTGELTASGIAELTEELGILEAAGLDAVYGCVEVDPETCPSTSKVKYLSYVDASGAEVEHRYQPGTVDSRVVPTWQIIEALMTNVTDCTSGDRITCPTIASGECSSVDRP